MPGQDWPRQLDNQTWWHAHWIGHSAVVVLTLFALLLVLPSDWSAMTLHNWLGYMVLVAMCAQVLLGVFRGSKGGPSAQNADGSTTGHHYDMTSRRKVFELAHKALGYLTLFLACLTILLGLWKANGPVWMWLSLIAWWAALVVIFVRLQKHGMAVDTYQGIWAPDVSHPGNQLPHPGWGVRRLGQKEGERDHVRSDRRDRV